MSTNPYKTSLLSRQNLLLLQSASNYGKIPLTSAKLSKSNIPLSGVGNFHGTASMVSSSIIGPGSPFNWVPVGCNRLLVSVL